MIKIYCCDAIYFLESLRDAGEKADMVMTDPHNTYNPDFNLQWLKLCHELLKDGKVLCSFCSPPTIGDFIRQAESVGFSHLQTIERLNKITGRTEPCMMVSKGEWAGKKFKYHDFHIGKPEVGKFPLEAVKPLRLIKSMIENFTKKGDTVIDMMLGSGTTAVACKDLKRNFKGSELDLEFSRIARNRAGFPDEYATGI